MKTANLGVCTPQLLQHQWACPTLMAGAWPLLLWLQFNWCWFVSRLARDIVTANPDRWKEEPEAVWENSGVSFSTFVSAYQVRGLTNLKWLAQYLRCLVRRKSAVAAGGEEMKAHAWLRASRPSTPLSRTRLWDPLAPHLADVRHCVVTPLKPQYMTGVANTNTLQ